MRKYYAPCFLFLTSAVLIAATGCGSSSQCAKDGDCPTGQTCNSGTCVAKAVCSPACTGAKPVCDTLTKKCAVCTSVAGCPSGKACDTSVAGGKCVDCLSSSQCSSNAPVCDTDTNACVTCLPTEGCASNETCDTSFPGGRCVGGDDCDPECGGSTPFCDRTTSPPKCAVCVPGSGGGCPDGTTCKNGFCEGCTTNEGCQTSTAKVCDTTTHQCVFCTATEGCASNETCDLTVAGGKCTGSGCSASSACSGETPVCDLSNNTCVRCTKAEGCTAGQVCDDSVPGGQCVECLASTDCKDTQKPACDSNHRCVACTATGGCVAPKTCDTSVVGGLCVACSATVPCQGGLKCDTSVAGGSCVTCNANVACAGGLKCDTSIAGGQCVDCFTSTDCKDPQKPICDSSHHCITCTSTEGCPAGKICDTNVSGGQCRGCNQSSECPTSLPVCATTAKECVVCLPSGEGCNGLTCVNGQCTGCTGDAQCAGTATPVCDLATHACVVCTSAKGCTAGQVCNSAVSGGQCVDCLLSTDCKDLEKPVCDSSHHCVTCTATTGCAAPKTCDTTIAGGACVTCNANVSCTGSLKCDTSTTNGACVTCSATVACAGNSPCDTTVTGGKCVDCLLDTDCKGNQKPVCDSNHQCVTCTATAGCEDPKICDTGTPGGQCVDCLIDSNCKDPQKPACDASNHCVTCTATAGCTDPKKCDTSVAGGQCVTCSATVPCTGGLKCSTSPAGGQCVECLLNTDCLDAQKPVCDASNHCVACTATAGCVDPKKCDTSIAGGQCVTCNANVACAGGLKCDTSSPSGQCVECLLSTDCTASSVGPVCDTARHACVVCTATAGCSAPTPKCDVSSGSGTCVQCLSQQDCSEPTPLCSASQTCVVDPSAQIAAIRAAAAGTIDLPVTGALVTYLKPALGTEPAGFFIQGAKLGPAIFVGVDPATNSTAVGDRISFTATSVGLTSCTPTPCTAGLKQVATLTNYAKLSGGESPASMIQNLSSASDIVSAVEIYESELVSISGTLGAFGNGGSSHVGAPIATTVLTDPSFKLRMPPSLQSSLALGTGCAVELVAGPLWRYSNNSATPPTLAEPSAYSATDLTVQSCPALAVVSAEASSATQVNVTFDRAVDPASLTAPATKFTFSPSLSVTGAVASGSVVALTTAAQGSGTPYTLTVSSDVKDIRSTGVGSSNTATFTGFVTTATLVINEAGPNITGTNRDLLELLAVTGGTVEGLKVVQGLSSSTTLATLPALTVAAGDLLLIHLNPPAEVTTETASKTACIDASCAAGAWDIAGANTHLTFSHRVVAIKAASGAIVEAVPFVKSDTLSPPASFPSDLQTIQTQGLWLPADCGGPCTNTNAVSISVDWKDAGTVASCPVPPGTCNATSVSRTAGARTRSSADWTVTATPSWGAPNP